MRRVELFLRAGENRLEMRRLFLAGDDIDLDLLEPRLLEPAMQVALGETEPAVAVQLAGAIEGVLREVEDEDLPVRLEDLVGGLDRFGRLFGVMQRLAEDREIDAVRFDRRILQIAEPELEVLQIVFLRLGGAERDDFFRVIDGDDFLATPREQLAEQSLPCAEVRDGERRKNAQQQMAER